MGTRGIVWCVSCFYVGVASVSKGRECGVCLCGVYSLLLRVFACHVQGEGAVCDCVCVWGGGRSCTVSTRLWISVLSPTPTPPLGCQVLIAFGRDASADYVIDSELYDPSSNSWSLSGAVSSGRIYHAAVGLNQGGAMFAAGGALWGRVGASLCVVGAGLCVCVCVCEQWLGLHRHWDALVLKPGVSCRAPEVCVCVRHACVCVTVCTICSRFVTMCVLVCGCAAVWQVS